LKTTLRDAGIAGIGLISPNIGRALGIVASAWDNREALGNILKGDATPSNYLDITNAIFDQILPGDESGESDDD